MPCSSFALLSTEAFSVASFRAAASRFLLENERAKGEIRRVHRHSCKSTFRFFLLVLSLRGRGSILPGAVNRHSWVLCPVQSTLLRGLSVPISEAWCLACVFGSVSLSSCPVCAFDSRCAYYVQLIVIRGLCTYPLCVASVFQSVNPRSWSVCSDQSTRVCGSYSSDTRYLFIRFRKLVPPQNRRLNIFISNSKH